MMRKFLFLSVFVVVIMAVMMAFDIVLASQVQKWPLPTEGVITREFGFHDSLENPKYHIGIDIQALSGNEIKVVEDGIVEETGYNQNYGLMVIVCHEDGLKTLYAHCSAIKVIAGDKVKVGDVIAFVGDTGQALEPHLHFEVRENETYLNPREYLKN